MAQFTVNATALRSVQELQVPGEMGRPLRRRASARSALLKRTTEVVKHREGGDPSQPQIAGPHRIRRDHARTRRHPRHRLRSMGQQGLELRRGARLGGLARRTSARTSSSSSTTRPGSSRSRYKVYRCWVSEYQAMPDLDANANAVAIQHIKLENEGWIADLSVTEPTEPTFTCSDIMSQSSCARFHVGASRAWEHGAASRRLQRALRLLAVASPGGDRGRSSRPHDRPPGRPPGAPRAALRFRTDRPRRLPAMCDGQIELSSTSHAMRSAFTPESAAEIEFRAAGYHIAAPPARQRRPASKSRHPDPDAARALFERCCVGAPSEAIP